MRVGGACARRHDVVIGEQIKDCQKPPSEPPTTPFSSPRTSDFFSSALAEFFSHRLEIKKPWKKKRNVGERFLQNCCRREQKKGQFFETRQLLLAFPREKKIHVRNAFRARCV
jgi:hypothetical protein